MSSIKELRTKIKSVKNTQKITRAMEMVATSKMRKAQERMRSARPYGDKIRAVAANLSQAFVDYPHPYLQKRESVKRVGLIVVTSDKGLCGGLNTNVLRLAVNKMKEFHQNGAEASVTAIGNKGMAFMSRNGAKVISSAVALGDTPHLEALIGPIKVMVDAFVAGEVDEVHLVYTKFVNTMKQEPTVEQLLPLSGEAFGQPEHKYNWEYLYEPDAKTVIDELMNRYVEALIFQAVAENIASEMAARMVAMKAATDNADKVIGNLQLLYNKTRQSAITTELMEIVSGASAV
ncbi:F-type H+-transporting ATPase subunit gamma [Silvimonas terrae]|uniref:ATP synthase gamma chain n=1 Tax=Silvimonas terrae TaxID=300266 RepID=A0A840RGU0_9NEIS|nr:F0F1 ATP synthase subunit gamma [Silvimonas terrae]MBB5191738.1 F-type H+-transporting ATPase subunit gamma [Silvimonas terrae]